MPVEEETPVETPVQEKPKPVDPGSINSKPKDQDDLDKWVEDNKNNPRR